MNPYQSHASDLADLEAETDACPAIWYNGGAIPVLPGGALFRQSHSIGGEMLSFDLQLTVLASSFGAVFNLNSLAQQNFQYPGQNGDSYRVAHIIKMPGSFQIRLLANAAAEGL